MSLWLKEGRDNCWRLNVAAVTFDTYAALTPVPIAGLADDNLVHAAARGVLELPVRTGPRQHDRVLKRCAVNDKRGTARRRCAGDRVDDIHGKRHPELIRAPCHRPAATAGNGECGGGRSNRGRTSSHSVHDC